MTRSGARRLCLMTDVEHYGRRKAPAQDEVQQRLSRMTLWACERARINPARGDRQDGGDGQLLIFPPGLDEVHALSRLVTSLRDALFTANQDPGAAGRIRLRVALAQGTVQAGATGFVSLAVVTAARLANSAELRAELTAHPDADLVAAITDDLYRDVIVPQQQELTETDFRPCVVAGKHGESAISAWMHVPRPGAARQAGRRSYDAGVPWGLTNAFTLPPIVALAVWSGHSHPDPVDDDHDDHDGPDHALPTGEHVSSATPANGLPDPQVTPGPSVRAAHAAEVHPQAHTGEAGSSSSRLAALMDLLGDGYAMADDGHDEAPSLDPLDDDGPLPLAEQEAEHEWPDWDHGEQYP